MPIWRPKDRRERRLAAFWLSRHLKGVMERADVSQSDAATASGVSARLLADLLKMGADGAPLSDFRAMHPALAASAVQWARQWVACAPLRMESASFPACHATKVEPKVDPKGRAPSKRAVPAEPTRHPPGNGH